MPGYDPAEASQALGAGMEDSDGYAIPLTAGQKALALRDELARQHGILLKDAPVRFVTTGLAYVLAAFFLPISAVVVCATGNFIGEVMCLRALKGLDPAKDPARYRTSLIWTFVLEISFCAVPAMIWNLDGEYMKAFAVGLAVTAVLHISAVRAIHLPMALTAFSAIIVATIASNAILWIGKGDMMSLAFTTVCAIAGLAYALGAILANNKLHRETARGWAAAQAANVTKGTFLAQMSHELRTPLNAILGMGHAELRRTDDPVSTERLSVLISAAEGLSTILDDILDMSAIQRGSLPIRRTTIAISPEIAATVALFRPQIEEAGLILILDLPDSLPDWVLMDSQRLRQCLSNLLSNALKNTVQGQITLSARRVYTAAGQRLRITVADTGPGIAPDIAKAMFEPFVRGPGTSLGTGLGLAITRALAQQMGGDLQLDQPGPGAPKGAHFILTLALDVATAPQTAEEKATKAPLCLKGRKVLVVDDIASNRLVAVTYLLYFGAEPVEVSSGIDALRCVSAGGIDLVLLDMNMPEMDGLETFHHLRQLPHPAGRVPVIAMTANTAAKDRATYASIGIEGYLAKPVTPESAATEIQRILQADCSNQ